MATPASTDATFCVANARLVLLFLVINTCWVDRLPILRQGADRIARVVYSKGALD
jgi:hypothetical protein